MSAEHWDLDQDNTLGGNSPSPNKVSSQKALKEYIDSHGGGGTVDQIYNPTSQNAQSGMAIAGAGFLQVKGVITDSTDLTTLEEGIYTIDDVTHSGFPNSSQPFYGVLIQYGGTYKPQLLVAGMPSVGGLYHRRYLTGSSAFTGWVRCGNSATGSNSFSMGGTPVAVNGGTVVGIEATTSANYGTSFGYKAKCTASSSVAVGRVSTASGAFSIAIGYGATVSSAGGKSIQLGFGTNSTATSLSVGFQDIGNYQLLDGTTGLIPDDRLSSNIARTSDIPSEVTESTVSGWGFTKNVGTITGITMNGSSKGTSGVVDLGTVITQHQDISGKQNTITGAASTVTSSNLTTGRVLISNSSGKIAVSSITSTVLDY